MAAEDVFDLGLAEEQLAEHFAAHERAAEIPAWPAGLRGELREGQMMNGGDDSLALAADALEMAFEFF